MTKIEKRFLATQEIEPNAQDLAALARIAEQNDDTKGITLEEMRALRKEQDKRGRISVRVSRKLRKELTKEADSQGISLEQYIINRLSSQ
ncbi:MAG: type II toxin-antitoxin system HicB family antitoxin [Defluviitaleaceae bacterium]|nr:type II toxin-antitoxin system HicB family antitoxin [Defluviitaleaceae bacterium]